MNCTGPCFAMHNFKSNIKADVDSSFIILTFRILVNMQTLTDSHTLVVWKFFGSDGMLSLFLSSEVYRVLAILRGPNKSKAITIFLLL